MKVAVVGTGYVGLVAGACFAEYGNDVTCIDRDTDKLAVLRRGESPIFEPGLSDILTNTIQQARMSFCDNVAEGIMGAEVIFIAVGTPEGSDGKADLGAVFAVATEIGKSLSGYAVIVDKSTVPVKTAEEVHRRIAAETDHDFDVVSNPEFLAEGRAVEDFMKPDRVVIGVPSERAFAVMKTLYEPFIKARGADEAPLFETDPVTAEASKYIANAMLATKISFMNEAARFADAVGADIEKIRQIIASDHRIGSHFLNPGVGYGGSCFPKDVQALEATGAEHGIDMPLVRTVHTVNEEQKGYLNTKIDKHFSGSLSGKHFALWGLAFKPHTDDMREAPSLVIAEYLLGAGATISAYDPQAMDECREHYLGDRIEYVVTPMLALDKADALIVVTEWPDFYTPNMQEMRDRMRGYVVFDGRNIYKKYQFQDWGFRYYGIGR